MLASLDSSFIMVLPLNYAWIWALGACLVGAALEGVMSGSRIRARFAELRLPQGSPPLWVWTVVGGAYYVLVFSLVRSLLNRPASPYWTPAALILTATLLLANASWNWIFFRSKDLRLSFLFFVPYLAAALMLAAILFRLRSPISSWYVVYLAYLAYATWWGYRVWRLNLK